jgi:hypothetical protein
MSSSTQSSTPIENVFHKQRQNKDIFRPTKNGQNKLLHMSTKENSNECTSSIRKIRLDTNS